MVEHRSWFVAVHKDGGFYSGYAKGPLANWVVMAGTLLFGPTNLGVRIGFALAAIALGLVLFECARSVASVRAGVATVLVYLSFPGVIELGSRASIDVLFTLFAVVSVAACVRAFSSERALRWVVLSGVALGSAVLVRAAAAAPVFLAVLATGLAWAAVNRSFRSVWRVTGPVLMIGGVIALVWIGIGWAQVGWGFVDHYFLKVVLQGGDERELHPRVLNDYYSTLSGYVAPWPLYLLPLGLFVGVRSGAAKSVDSIAARIGIVAYALSIILVFHVLGGKFLRWYSFQLIPVAALGGGLLLGSIFEGRIEAAGGLARGLLLGAAVLAAEAGGVDVLLVLVAGLLLLLPGRSPDGKRLYSYIAPVTAILLVLTFLTVNIIATNKKFRRNDRFTVLQSELGSEMNRPAYVIADQVRVAEFYFPNRQKVPKNLSNLRSDALVALEFPGEVLDPTCSFRQIGRWVLFEVAECPSFGTGSLFPWGHYAYEAENLRSRCGRSSVVAEPTASGGKARVALPSCEGGTLAFGPYQPLLPGKWLVTWSLKRDERYAVRDDRQAVLDVVVGGRTLAARHVSYDELDDGEWRDFAVEVDSYGAGVAEFRVSNVPAGVLFDRVVVQALNANIVSLPWQ